MKVNSVIRYKVRKDGSIGIPKRVRDAYGIRGGDIIDFYVDKNKITIRLSSQKCPVCGNRIDIANPIGPVDVCSACSEKIHAMVRKGNSIGYAMTAASRKGRVTSR